MKTHYLQLTKTKTAIIVELEENEIKELEKGEPITIQLKTTFYKYNKPTNERLTQQLNQLEEKLKL